MNLWNQEIQALTNTIAIKQKILDSGETDDPVKLQNEITMLRLLLQSKLKKII